MKHTEQRWMRKSNGHMAERGFTPDRTTTMDVEDYRLVTVTWDEPEYEDVEVVRWEIRDVETYWFRSRTDAELVCDRLKIPHDHIIELKGIDRRPKPEPEVWEGEIVARDTYGGNVIVTRQAILSSWIGKRVRVEVIL